MCPRDSRFAKDVEGLSKGRLSSCTSGSGNGNSWYYFLVASSFRRGANEGARGNVDCRIYYVARLNRPIEDVRLFFCSRSRKINGSYCRQGRDRRNRRRYGER